MRVHHLNCATMCPFGGRLVSGEGALFAPAKMVCHCLLIETNAGLVLVDTGLGLDDLAHPRERLAELVWLVRPRLDPEETAIRQIERAGFRADDVRHVVLTHLDVDHAGGLPDFPRAKIHIHDAELAAATALASRIERMRYRTAQWAHGPDWVRHTPRGEPWYGFQCVRQMEGLPPEVLLVPLAGHTRGHCAIAVDTGGASGGPRWLLHAGDAYFFRGEIDPVSPRCPAGLDVFQRILEMDRGARLGNQRRLRELARDHAGDVAIFCAHDPVELERFDPAFAPARAAAA